MTAPQPFRPVDTASAKKMSASEAIEYHYDNETRFFSLWLDPTLSYSAARWHSPFGDALATDLETAQREKLRHHLDAAALPEGGRLLDIGCGWGAVLEGAVARDPTASALGLTLSRDQHAHITARATPGVSAALKDFFAFESDTPFDGAISIGAFEHFARPEMDRAAKIATYRTFFERLAGLLTKGSRFSLQTIVWNNVDFETSKILLPETVFPQSDIPFLEEIAAASHETFRLAYVENNPTDYALTLSAWIANLKAERETILAEWDDEKYAFFERYLRRSRLAFKQGPNSLARLVLVRR
ncbi:MAG: hypothetical protein AcusKO_36830 [Acuticoccus sp.]